jgi:hypothetical protein
MAQDTLILFCKNVNDAIISSKKIERKHDLNRLYVFLGKKPEAKEMSWIAPSDSMFVLERAINWSKNPESLGVRAGLMLASGWDLMFCWADNCPDERDVGWIREQIKSGGIARLPNIWGVSRDHYILYGLGEEIQMFDSQTQNSIESGLNIADALDGKPVDLNVAIQTLQEIVHLSAIAVHNSAANEGFVVDEIKKITEYIDNEAPVSAIVGESCTEDEMLILKNKIANHGALIQISKKDSNYAFKPYRVILIKDGTKISLYGK